MMTNGVLRTIGHSPTGAQALAVTVLVVPLVIVILSL